ncbi:N-acetylmuramoyl-L-alanine amidase [uncultured Granulicatella sp.]|uniref:N-acetylmuramoyl-L-alanine amidase n=1 Tax=uncultured Granulicatella sp. TaxID=316089 RepID=UPI0028D202B8|nr:N-acetylmuramoyl-L-alanine amidase [uncultured Granulicatella sp.]
MVEKINETLMDAGRLSSIDFVVIHNDAGSMTPYQYIEWLRYREKSLGIAHYYCNRNCIARVIDTYNIGYHTGEWWSNIHSIGYEVCESMKVSDEEFLQNEDMTLMQATEDLLFYGLPINTDTVRLHHEFVPTSCPHRSLALHGGTTESVKNYFVERMNYFASLGSTVDEMLGNEIESPIITQDEEIHSTSNSNEEVAREVIQGIWGNGEERFDRLTDAGYDANYIQEIVNRMLNGDETPNVSDIDTIAQEVIMGEWGNGYERKERLENSGYDYQVIQSRVNELLG